MKQVVIGIAGQKNSGKDTVASMINYIATVGCAAANYQQWMVKKAAYDIKTRDKIIHFADSLKDCLSIIYDIPRRYFDNRRYKDELFYVFDERRFISYEDYQRDTRYHLIEISDLDRDSLSYIINDTKLSCIIELRTLMQYFGTLCREELSDTIWVDSTMRKAHSIAVDKGYCIIPDVRHKIEVDAIMKSSLYGGVIVIKRDNIRPEHSSEEINFEGSNVIINDSTLMKLFYRVLNFMQNL